MNKINKTFGIFFYLLIFNNLIVIAQKNKLIEYEKLNLKIVDSSFSKTSFKIYKTPYKASPKYYKLSQAKNLTPEALMESTISASTQEWINYNTHPDRIKHTKQKQKGYFDQIQEMDRDSNYYLLRSKFCFEEEGKEYCYMRFGMKLEQAKKSGLIAACHFLVKDNGRWYKTVPRDMAKGRLTWVFLMFKPDILMQIFKKEKIGHSLHDSFIEKVIHKDQISLELLTEELFRIASGRDEVKEEATYFLEDRNW